MYGCSRAWPFENGADSNITVDAFSSVFLPGMIEAGQVMQADAIEELAEKPGLPAAVKRCNELCYKGENED